MEEKINNKTKDLYKDLKKVIVVSLIILAGLVILIIVNMKTDFLLKLTEFIMAKFVG